MLASSQSLLGLGGDALVIAGFVLLWLRRRRDPLVLSLTLLSVIAWVAFVATLIRFPQTSGDPIKSSYLLFLAPVAAISGVAAGERLWHDRRGRVVLAAWSLLYVVSFVGVLVTTYSAHPRTRSRLRRRRGRVSGFRNTSAAGRHVRRSPSSAS